MYKVLDVYKGLDMYEVLDMYKGLDMSDVKK